MDTSFIVVIVLGLIFLIGGPILGRLATKATDKAEMEEMNKTNNK